MLIALLLTFISCIQKQELTQQEKDQIKQELTSLINSFVKVYERGDVEAALEYYWNSPDFISVGADASVKDYQSFKKENEEQLKSLISTKIITVKQEYRIINRETVITLWYGRFEVNMKDGGILVFDPDVVTWVLQKINNEWKITYQADSGLPPVVQAAKK